jgi:hypothetical protein
MTFPHLVSLLQLVAEIGGVTIEVYIIERRSEPSPPAPLPRERVASLSGTG